MNERARNTGGAVTPLLVDARTVAELLSLSPRTVWSLSASGELPSVKVRSRRLYDPHDLREWIRTQKRNGDRSHAAPD